MIVDLGYGRGWAEHAAAQSIFRIDRALGRPLRITEAGRTRARQQQLWDWYRAGVGAQHGIVYPPARPGTSPHETGLAIDASLDHDWLIANGPAYGWLHDVPRDYPHFVYHANRDAHVGTAGGIATPLQEEDNVFGTFLADPKNGYTLVGAAGSFTGITPAMHAVLNAQGLILQRPTKVMSAAGMTALLAKFPPVNSHVELSAEDVAEIVAALENGSDAAVLAAIAALDQQGDTYQAQVLAALATVDEATLATFGLKRA